MNPWRGLGRLPRELWILSAVALVNRAGTMVLPFLALFLTQERGVDATRAGFGLVAYALGALVSAPLAGRLTDRLGARRVMVISLVASGFVVMVLPFAPGLWGFVAAVSAWSILAEALRPANLAAISTAVGTEDRRAAFALSRLAINLGMSIGPAVGGYLSTISFRALFWIDGITTLAAAALLVLGTRTVPPAAAATADPDLESSRRTSALHDRQLLYFLLATLPAAIVFFQHIGALPIHLVRNLALSPAFYGLLFTVNTVLIVLVEVPLNLRMGHWSHRANLVVGSVFFAIGFGALAFTATRAGVIASVVVWTVGEMILFPALSAAVADFAPAHLMGAYMGLYQVAFSLAFLVGPWGGIVLLDRVGAAAPWIASFALALLSALLFSRMRGEVARRSGTAEAA